MTVTPSSRAAPLATRAPRSGEPEELALLADEMQATGRALDALVAACPPERAPALAAAALLCGPRAGDELLEAVWEGLDARVALAGASRLATRLPAERALRWSARLRESGLGAHCPLVAAARDLGSPPSERARRAAVAWRAFGDPGARTLALDAASEIESTTVRASLREELDAIAPDVASVLHETARTSPGVTSGPPGGGAGRGTRVRVLLGVDHDSRATCEARWREVLDERADELLAADGGPDGRGARTAAAVHSPRVAGDAEEILVLVDGTLHPAAGWRAALVRLFALRRDVAFAAAVVSARAPAGERAATVGMELLLDARYEPTLVARPCPVEEAPGHGLGSVEIQACAPGGFAVRRSVFEELGGLDPSLPEPYATVDLCLRAGARGWRVAHDPGWTLHATGATAAAAAAGPLEEFDRRWLGLVGPDRVVGVPGPPPARAAGAR